MFPVLAARFIALDVKQFLIRAPRVAAHWAPGHFVIVRVDEAGERIPLTVADVDRESGSITLIVQGVGRTTRMLNRLEAGGALADVAGPLGLPSEVEHFGTVVVIGGGVGTAIAYPTARAMADAGNRVIVIVGGRTADHLILTDQISEFADELIVTTDDGSSGREGLVTDALVEIIDREAVDRVVAIGPIPMMKAVADLTRPHGIPTVASLNPIMVDGTGMCGGCRVLVGGVTRFACVDGPEFNAHEVDFEVLATRNQAYTAFEAERRACAQVEP
jgi:ferredoxin--NADP+ reductase